MTSNLATDLDAADSNTLSNDETDFISAQSGRAAASSTADAALLMDQQLPAVKASGSQTSQDQLQGDVVLLPVAVQCSEDLSESDSSLVKPVFYACGSRLFQCRTIFDVNRGNNNVIRYGAEEFSSVENAHDDDVSGRLLVSDRICPYCSLTVASSVSHALYEQHVQSHLDSDAGDDVIS